MCILTPTTASHTCNVHIRICTFLSFPCTVFIFISTALKIVLLSWWCVEQIVTSAFASKLCLLWSFVNHDFQLCSLFIVTRPVLHDVLNEQKIYISKLWLLKRPALQPSFVCNEDSLQKNHYTKIEEHFSVGERTNYQTALQSSSYLGNHFQILEFVVIHHTHSAQSRYPAKPRTAELQSPQESPCLPHLSSEKDHRTAPLSLSG